MSSFSLTAYARDLVLSIGHDWRDTIAVERQVASGYVTTGHTMALTVTTAAGSAIISAHPLTDVAVTTRLAGSTTLMTATGALHLSPEQVALLSPTTLYTYVVEMTDSLTEKTPVVWGMILAMRVA